MRKLIVNEFMSLDGVVQAPGGADEDTTGGFKQEDGRDLLVIGSSQLVAGLLARGLVDELQVMIDPLVLGGGKRIFRDDGRVRPLRLVEGRVTTTGAFLGTYAPR